MKGHYALLALLGAILSIIVILAILYNPSSKPNRDRDLESYTQNVTKHIYEDSEYGFKFEYPNNYKIEKTANSIKLIRGSILYAEFSFPEMYIGKPNDQILNFGEYAAYFAKAMCDASGPTGNTYCDSVDNITAVKNSFGTNIKKIYLHEVTEPYDRHQISERIKEPMYAIDANGHIGEGKLILLIQYTNSNDEYQTSTMEEILESFSF